MATTQAGIIKSTHEALSPLAYDMTEVLLRTHDGREFDIRYLVDSVTITESIYRMGLTASIRIFDAVDLLANKQISGQESIKITWIRTNLDTNETLKIVKTFYVADAPLYVKPHDHNQVYQLDCVTKGAYISQLTHISRAINGSCTSIIRKIVENDLQSSNDISFVTDRTVTNFRGIIPNLRPLAAISWILERASDSKTYPLYVYDTLNDGIRIESLADMLESDSYRTYQHGSFFTNEAQTPDDYTERASRIAAIQSDLYLSKYLNAADGAYASTTQSFDIATKTFTERVFRYRYPDDNVNSRYGLVSESFKPDEVNSLSESVRSAYNYIPTNSRAYAKNKNCHEAYANIVGAKESIETNLDSFVHDIQLIGDFGLRSGMKVTVEFARPIDPSLTTTDIDRYLSGDYVVTGIVHTFGNNYMMDVRIKRDTMSVKLNDEVALNA